MSWINALFGKTTKGDIKELKALEKAILKKNIPIDREPGNALLERIADSKNKNAIPILQNIAKTAEEYLVLFKKAELHKKPGMWMISANVEEIIKGARAAIGKINSEI